MKPDRKMHNAALVGERVGTVRLTYLMMLRLRSACKRAQRQSQRNHEKDATKGWRPEPGKGDANLARVAVLQDIINQLDAQIETAERRRRNRGQETADAQPQGD